MITNRMAAGFVLVGAALLALSLIAGPAAGEESIATAPDVVAVDRLEQGRALFLAKSCTTCHERGLGGAPNLRVYDPDPAFLRVWLRDPAAVRPGTAMPNLKLDGAEIEALIVFLQDYSNR